jgi:putative spermidine/putrescine transport system permease protein
VVGARVLVPPAVGGRGLSFNTVASLSWPPKGFTLHWWRLAAHSSGARDALIVSLKTAVGATAIALVLGLLAALAIHRFRFFGRESLNLMIVLPIALPGIVTGIALNAAFRQVGFAFGYLTLIIAHATFCIVVLYNNIWLASAAVAEPRGGVR